MSAWYPYKVSAGLEVPDNSRPVIELNSIPDGDWWGPFHCLECADARERFFSKWRQMMYKPSDKMEGGFYLPNFGDSETAEENEAFARAHFVNHGKRPPPAPIRATVIFAVGLIIVLSSILWAVAALTN